MFLHLLDLCFGFAKSAVVIVLSRGAPNSTATPTPTNNIIITTMIIIIIIIISTISTIIVIIIITTISTANENQGQPLSLLQDIQGV